MFSDYFISTIFEFYLFLTRLFDLVQRRRWLDLNNFYYVLWKYYFLNSFNCKTLILHNILLLLFDLIVYFKSFLIRIQLIPLFLTLPHNSVALVTYSKLYYRVLFLMAFPDFILVIFLGKLLHVYNYYVTLVEIFQNLFYPFPRNLCTKYIRVKSICKKENKTIYF